MPGLRGPATADTGRRATHEGFGQRHRSRPATPETAPAWSQGLLAFNDTALPDAAAQLARYTGKRILVWGERARAARVSGTAGIADPRRALDLLAQTKVEITDLPGLLILR